MGPHTRGVAASHGVVRFPFLLVALVVASAVKTAGADSITLCTDELQACMNDANCYVCMMTWPSGNKLSACARYPFVVASEPMVRITEDGSCQKVGAQNCCGFETGMAERCMENANLEAYWACNLERQGCTLQDMPCSIAGAAAAEMEAETKVMAVRNAASDGSPTSPSICRCGTAAAAVAAAATIALAAAGL